MVWLAQASAQTPPEGPVQAPEVLVSENRPPTDAGGATRVDLQAEDGAPLGPWDELGREVANFHAADSGSGGFGSLFALRGLANTPYFSEPAVTVYLADIPLPSSAAYPSALAGLGSATVYRGPQGTAFGRATDGGVVVFDAGAGGQAGGEALATLGGYDLRQASAALRTAPGGKADAEIAASYGARDGYLENRQLGTRVDGLEGEDTFARVRLRPAGGDELTLEVFGARERDGAEPLVPLGGPLFEVSRAREGQTDLDGWGAALKGAFALPAAATLTSVTSYTDWRMNPYEDFLVLPPPLESRVLQDQRSWNEDLRLRTDPRAGLRVSLGAWLSKGTTRNAVDRLISDTVPIEASSFEQGSRSAALFGETALALGAWQITAGLRAEADEKDFVRREQVPTPGLDYAASARYGGILPRVAANWAVSADSHAEASLALGLRPGGFASYTDNPALIPFAQERVVAAAAGWDSSLAHGALRLAARAFYDAIGNLQIERSFTPTDYFVATAPRAHALGGEFEGRWRASARWAAAVSAGWEDVRLDRFRAPLTGADESGNRAPGAPRFNLGAEVTYRPGPGWFATAQVAATGATAFDELGTPRYSQGAYALLGLRAGYGTPLWSLTLFGENLGNTGYYALIVPGVNSANPGAPRTVGAKAAVRF